MTFWKSTLIGSGKEQKLLCTTQQMGKEGNHVPKPMPCPARQQQIGPKQACGSCLKTEAIKSFGYADCPAPGREKRERTAGNVAQLQIHIFP